MVGFYKFFNVRVFLKKKDESPRSKPSNVQLLKVDQSPYFEEFETSNSVSSQDGSLLVATPLNRRDETGSEGSRESSTSGDSRAIRASFNSSVASGQSDAVVRRQREAGTLSPYVSTPVTLRHEEGDVRRDRQDVSAFRARQVRSAVFTGTDWTSNRLPRPRSMDSLDKVPVTSTLASSDIVTSGLPPGNGELGATLPRSKKKGMMKHLSPSASPRGLRKARWAQSSPNISPVPARRDYVTSLEPPPPSPPSPTSSKKSQSPRQSPVVARRVEERPLVWSPTHSPLLTKRGKKNTSSGGSGSRRASMPSSYIHSLDTVPVRDRPVDAPKPKVSVQVVPVTNASDISTSQSPSLSNQGNQWNRIPRESSSGNEHDSVAPIHERKSNGTSDRVDTPMTSTPREGSTTDPPHINSRGRSSSDGPRAKELPTRGTGLTDPSLSRERSLSGDKYNSFRVNPAKDSPSQDTVKPGPVHFRSLSADRNDGRRISQRQGTLFAASSVPRQSVPVTAHYVSSGTIAKSEPLPVFTSAEGGPVCNSATGTNVSSTFTVSPSKRPEFNSSSMYAIVRDKHGEERMISGPPSRDLPALQRDEPPTHSSVPSTGAASRQSNLTSSTLSTSRSTVSTSRDTVVAAAINLKPSPNENKDENRNDTKIFVKSATTQEGSKQMVTSVRARIHNIEHQPAPSVSQPQKDENVDGIDDALTVSSQRSRDVSPALRKLRNRGKKPDKEKEIFVDSSPSSDAVSTASGNKSSEERSQSRPGGIQDPKDKKSSVWYEYGCVWWGIKLIQWPVAFSLQL